MVFDEDTAPWVKWTLAAAVLGLACVVAAAVALVIAPFGGESGREADPLAKEPPASTSVCGLPDGDQELPTRAPAARWETLQGGWTVPASDELGPGRGRSGGKRSCFAHNPLGAVFAAMNQADDADANPGRIQFLGFKVVSYSGAAVDLEIVGRVTSGEYTGVIVAVPGRLVWQDGDWTLEKPATEVEPRLLSSMSGYIGFAAPAAGSDQQ